MPVKPQKLFEPISIGKMRLKNRIIMPPMGTNYATDEGEVTDRLIDYYAERARGGAGLVMVEIVCVDAPAGKFLAHQLCLHRDSHIPGFRRLAQEVHDAGAKIAMQIHHAGRRTWTRLTGRPLVAPSPIPFLGGEMPRELTVAEIEGLVSAFAQTSRRAQEAGFDAVELHCAHGYLISQFLSPLTNRRTDKYGGDFDGRMRFPLEVLAAVKEQTGRDYPVLCRINGDDGVPGGISLSEARLIARRLEQAGADAIHVSASASVNTVEEQRQAKFFSAVPTMGNPLCCFVHLARGIKESVRIPVIGVGRIISPLLAEEVLQRGDADLVSIGRGLIVDPLWPQKAASGNFEDIRMCIGCYTCLDTLNVETATACAINPAAGHEREYRIEPATRRKRVLVIGGGPAGMEAALVAAQRGHQVTLYEKEPQLGGNLIAASTLALKQDIRRLLEHQTAQLHKLQVEVVLGQSATVEEVRRRRPDVVVMATGAVSAVPGVPGLEKNHVAEAVGVLTGKARVGQRVIVVGGGMVGCEVAAFLAERLRQVTLVTRRGGEGLAQDLTAPIRNKLLNTVWPVLGIEVVPHAELSEVTEMGLVVEQNGTKKFLPGDTIVLARGLTPQADLAQALKGLVPELYRVGDCVEPRKIREAIREGYEIGLRI